MTGTVCEVEEKKQASLILGERSGRGNGQGKCRGAKESARGGWGALSKGDRVTGGGVEELDAGSRPGRERDPLEVSSRMVTSCMCQELTLPAVWGCSVGTGKRER